MVAISTIETMTLDGGMACLDLVNSGYDTQPGIITDRMFSYADLITLSSRLGILDQQEIAALSLLASKNSTQAAKALNNLKKFRELMYQVLVAMVHKKLPALNKAVLKELNTYLAESITHRELILSQGAFKADWKKEKLNLEKPLWLFVFSASELLSSDKCQYVKQCTGCAWLFIDESKSHRRKWCDMKSCGANEKYKRFSLKLKTENTSV
jgi:predicted RNA-binding Zn ribbon-like protein